MKNLLNNKISKILVSALAAAMIVNTCAMPVCAAEKKTDKEYVLCKSNGEVKKYIISDEESGKLQYLNEDASCALKTKVTYKLDNKEVKPEDIAGAKGNVSIDIDYKGLDGYSVLTLFLLDETKFSDISVKSGKIISDGEKSIIAGITKVPGTLHLEAKTSGFEVKVMYAVATDSLVNDQDLEDFAPIFGIDISSIKDTIKELKSVSSKSSDDDISISEGIGELTDGIGQLSDGLTTLNDNSDALVAGSRQVFQSLIDMANEEIQKSGAEIPTLTISNYNKVLTAAINQATPEGVTNTAKAVVTEKVQSNEAVIEAAVEKAVMAEVTNKVTLKAKESVKQAALSAMGYTEDDFNKMVAAGVVNAATVDSMVEAKMADPEIQEKIAAGVQEQMASKEVKKIISQKTQEKMDSLVTENMGTPEVQSQIAAGIAKGSAGAPALKTLKAKLDSYNKFYQGLIQYTDGVSKAQEGAATINSVTAEFAGNTKDLLNDDTLGLIKDADELLDKADKDGKSVKYIIKFDSIR